MSSLPKTKQLTAVQRAALFKVLAGTAYALGERQEPYRKRIMLEELGVEHLNEVSRTEGYDKLMCRLYMDRGDYSRASDYLGGSLKRWRHLIVSAARKVTRKGTPYDYIQGVMIQSKMLPEGTPRSACEKLVDERGWLDLTEEQLRSLLAIINTRATRMQA